MFEIGWSEMAIILLVALIVIGPRDLPRVARNIGRWVGKGRAMAREFQTSLEDMAREAELDDVKREIEKAGRVDIGKTIEKTVDPSGELGKAFDTKASGDKASANAEAGGAKAPETESPTESPTKSATKTPEAGETVSAAAKPSEAPGAGEAKRRQPAKKASPRTRAAKAPAAKAAPTKARTTKAASTTKAPAAKASAGKARTARAKTNGASKAKAAAKTPANGASATDAEVAARDPVLAETS